MELSPYFLSDTLKRFRYYKMLGEKSFEQLNEKEMHYQVNEESNSIAIIIQHMHGNMISRFTNFLTEDGEKEWRKRDAEFEPTQLSKADLLARWNEGWELVLYTISTLKPNDLLQEITVRSEKLFAFDAILRQLAHYAYHIGQIIFIAKMFRNAQWNSLSIPRNKSKEYEQEVRRGNNHNGMSSGKI